MALDQENETQQMEIEGKIIEHLQALYDLLQKSDLPKAEEHIGYVAEMKAFWEGDEASFDEEE